MSRKLKMARLLTEEETDLFNSFNLETARELAEHVYNLLGTQLGYFDFKPAQDITLDEEDELTGVISFNIANGNVLFRIEGETVKLEIQGAFSQDFDERDESLGVVKAYKRKGVGKVISGNLINALKSEKITIEDLYELVPTTISVPIPDVSSETINEFGLYVVHLDIFIEITLDIVVIL